MLNPARITAVWHFCRIALYLERIVNAPCDWAVPFTCCFWLTVGHPRLRYAIELNAGTRPWTRARRQLCLREFRSQPVTMNSLFLYWLTPIAELLVFTAEWNRE